VYINIFVPNKRAKGQKLVGIPMDIEFIKEMDACAKAKGYSDRSKFVREAVYEKMEDLGCHIVRQVSEAPPRFGKGGAVNYRKSSNSDQSSEISVLEEVKKGVQAIVASDSEVAPPPGAASGEGVKFGRKKTRQAKPG
jgi:hypothetical protein